MANPVTDGAPAPRTVPDADISITERREGPVGEIDRDDLVRIEERFEGGRTISVDAESFVSSDLYASYGTPEERLNLLRNNAVSRRGGHHLPIASDLESYVAGLRPPDSTLGIIERSGAQDRVIEIDDIVTIGTVEEGEGVMHVPVREFLFSDRFSNYGSTPAARLSLLQSRTGCGVHQSLADRINSLAQRVPDG